jgi:hypothetical protein
MTRTNVYLIADYRARRQALRAVERGRLRAAGKSIVSGADPRTATVALAQVIAFPTRRPDRSTGSHG